MKGIKKILSMVLAIVCIIGLFPTAKVEASIVTVNGGYTTRANAYSWGTYSTTNTITVVLPETEEDFWVKFTLPKEKRVYARCSYNAENEGMYLEMRNSSNRILDEKNQHDLKWQNMSMLKYQQIILVLKEVIDNNFERGIDQVYESCVKKLNDNKYEYKIQIDNLRK